MPENRCGWCGHPAAAPTVRSSERQATTSAENDAPRVCPTCDGDGVILPLGSRTTEKCPDCDGRRLTNAEYKAARVIPPGGGSDA